MICALLIDLDDSVDFPDNSGVALDRPLAYYPVQAAAHCPRVKRLYVFTDSQPVKAAALQHGGIVLDPPQPRAHGDAFWHLTKAYEAVKADLAREGETVELLVVLFANAPVVSREVIEKGLDELLAKPELDSALTVSPNNRWHPFYARKEAGDGLLAPYIPSSSDARGDVWFPDWGATILRPRDLENPTGAPPLPWLGKNVLALKQWGGGPIDYQWQIPSLEYWLRKHGASEAPEPQPKPQPQTKPR